MEPISIAVITGLVTLMTAYMKYKTDMEQATAKNAPSPATSREVEQGERSLAVVEQGVAQHGKDDEKTALAGFKQNPDMFAPVLQNALKGLADREPAFSGLLQTMAQQANIQTGGVQGSVNVSGQGKVDQAAGVNPGTMIYHARDDDEAK